MCEKETLKVGSLSKILVVKITSFNKKQIAQSVEHSPRILKVVGSLPVGGNFSMGQLSSLIVF